MIRAAYRPSAPGALRAEFLLRSRTRPPQGRARAALRLTAGAMLSCLIASGTATAQEDVLRQALQQRNQLIEQLLRRVEALEREMRAADQQERPPWLAPQTALDAKTDPTDPAAAIPQSAARAVGRAAANAPNDPDPHALKTTRPQPDGPLNDLTAMIPAQPAAPPTPPPPPAPMATLAVPPAVTPLIQLPPVVLVDPVGSAPAAARDGRESTHGVAAEVTGDTVAAKERAAPIAEPPPLSASELDAVAAPVPDAAPVTAAMIKPATPPPEPQASDIPAKACRLSSEQRAMVDALRRRGDAMFALGDVSAARRLYERASTAGSAEAARSMGETYDPEVLARIKVRGLQPDPAAAARWYRRATELNAALQDRGGSIACPD
jgi:hypothetical protein